MDIAEEAAQTVLRCSLRGTRLAVHITGAAATRTLHRLRSALSAETPTQGQVRLSSLFLSGDRITACSLPAAQMAVFSREAGRQGLSYAVMEETDCEDLTLLLRAEDLAKAKEAARKTGTDLTEEAELRGEPEPEPENTPLPILRSVRERLRRASLRENKEPQPITHAGPELPGRSQRKERMP